MACNVQPSAPGPRPPWRRFAEARGLIGGYTGAPLTARLTAGDGVALVGSLLPGPNAHGVAVLLAHGFAANRRKPAYVALAEGLGAVAPVLALDLRGHGASAGASTFGDAECADVVAGARWLRAWGAERIVLVGVSMGATAVLRARARELDPLATVVVSAPARFRSPAPPGPLRRLEQLWHSPLRRSVLAASLGVRLAPPSAWGSPPPPVETAAGSRGPLLVVHGADDPYFPPTDAEEVRAAAGDAAVLWHEPAGFGHAEDGLTPAFVPRLAAAVEAVIATGRFPTRPRPSGQR